MAQYWYEGSSGESPSGPFHADRDCNDLDGSIRPIAEAVMAEDAELCSCVPLESDSDSGGTTGSFDPSEHTVSEIRDHVQSIDGSNIEAELEAIREREVETKDRKTALEAIDAEL